MADTYHGRRGRAIGIAIGSGSSLFSVATFLLIAIPNDLLPASVANALLAVAPWLGTVGRELGTGAIVMVLVFCVTLLSIGLWTLRGALFEEDYSITITYSDASE